MTCDGVSKRYHMSGLLNMGDYYFELGRDKLGEEFGSCVLGQQSLTVWFILSDGHSEGGRLFERR